MKIMNGLKALLGNAKVKTKDELLDDLARLAIKHNGTLSFKQVDKLLKPKVNREADIYGLSQEILSHVVSIQSNGAKKIVHAFSRIEFSTKEGLVSIDVNKDFEEVLKQKGVYSHVKL